MKPIQSTINGTLTQLARLLGPLSPFAKAIVPAVLSLAELAVNAIFAHSIDGAELGAALSGLVLAGGVYLIPNVPNVPKKP